ncbi:MAG: DUF3795 domain-containing protein [Candidatus Eisenbacteria bacterium]|nr:DUF3795 domain-containing protein [Candidatus Eisenbacteria bacterium]
MDDQTRRRFCQLCLAAGAGIGSGLLTGTALPSSADSTALTVGSKKTGHPDEKSAQSDGKLTQSDEKLDYTKIGYCGYRCDICPGRSKDRAVRRKMVDGWIKIFGHTSYTDENIPVAKPCAGCKGEGRVADVQCQARACAREKGVASCADCSEFPCDKLRPLMAARDHLLMYVRDKSVTLEEYTMSAMQFESMPVLLNRMADNGKLPSWVKKLI